MNESNQKWRYFWGIVLLVGGAIIFGVSLYVLANLPNAPDHIFRN